MIGSPIYTDPRLDRGPRWYAWLTALVIAGYPVISFIPAFLPIPNRAVTVPFRAIVVGVSLRVIVDNLRNRRLHSGFAAVAFLIFWCIYFVRIAMDTTFVPVALSRPTFEFLTGAVGMCFLPACAAFSVVRSNDVQRALRLTISLAAITVGLSITWFIRAVLSGNITSGTAGFARLSTDYLNPISMGHLGVTLALLLLFQMATRAPTSWGQVPRILGICAGLLIVGASASKAPMLALALAAPALVWIAAKHGIGQRAMVFAVAATILAIWGAVVLQERIGFGVIARVGSALQPGGDEGNQLRLYAVQNAWSEFLDHPLTGYQLEEPLFGQYPHNIAVEAFMATGILGGTLVCGLILAGTKAAASLIFQASPEAWIGILYVQYMAAAFVSGALYESGTAWFMLAAVISFAARERNPFFVKPKLQAVSVR